jgi:hypothetical protein
MKYTYISIDWNIKETDDVALVPSFLEKVENTYFEKRTVVKEEKIEVLKEEKIEVLKEEPTKEIDNTLIERAREYCKEQKVRGYWLLKDQKLIDTAVANGFIL